MAIPYRFYHSQSKEQKRQSLFFLLLFFFVFEEKILSYKWREFVEEATPTNKRSSNNINNDECEVNNCQKKTRNPITKPFAVNFHMHYGLVCEAVRDNQSVLVTSPFMHFAWNILRVRSFWVDWLPLEKYRKLSKFLGQFFFVAHTLFLFLFPSFPVAPEVHVYLLHRKRLESFLSCLKIIWTHAKYMWNVKCVCTPPINTQI